MYSIPFRARARGTSGGSLRRSDRRGFQIGPRIRVGGSIGKAGQKLKEGAGKVLSNKYVDMGLSLIPGVGPGLAAAANATGHVLDTSNGGIHSAGDLGRIALDAGTVYAGSKALGSAKNAFSTGGIKELGKKVAVGGVKKLTGGGGAQGGADGGRSSVLDALLLGGTVAASTADKLRQQKMQDQARDYATGSYDARAGLRSKGIADMLNPTKADLSDVFASQGNPYARPLSPRTPIRSY